MEDRLHKLAALADAGSFIQAAKELHISQPALSAAIRKLERELKIPLIVHGVRPVTLTPAGQAAYAAAKELAVSVENLQLNLAELANAEIALRIGMIDSVASSMFVAGAAIAQPDERVRLSVMVNNSRLLVQAVEQDEIDIAFIAHRPLRSPLLQVTHLANEPLIAVCHPEQQAAYAAAVQQGALPKFISYDQHSTTCRLIQETLNRRQLRTEPRVFSTSPEVMVRLVRLGQGAAVLPFATVEPLLDSGELAIVGQETPGVIPRGIAAVQRRDKTLPQPVQQLSRQVRRILESSLAQAQALVSTPKPPITEQNTKSSGKVL